LEIPQFANLHIVQLGSFRNDRVFLINGRREAGAFQARIDSFNKSLCETPLLPSSIQKCDNVILSEAKDLIVLYINWLMDVVIGSLR
jgi:hypothetical protein